MILMTKKVDGVASAPSSPSSLDISKNVLKELDLMESKTNDVEILRYISYIREQF